MLICFGNYPFMARISRWVYNAVKILIKRWVIMLIVALTIFATCMGIFAPTLVNLYVQWSKEVTAPTLFRIHPYLIPVVISIVVLALALAFLIYAGIREYKKQEHKKDELPVIKDELRAIKERLDKIETRPE